MKRFFQIIPIFFVLILVILLTAVSRQRQPAPEKTIVIEKTLPDSTKYSLTDLGITITLPLPWEIKEVKKDDILDFTALTEVSEKGLPVFTIEGYDPENDLFVCDGQNKDYLKSEAVTLLVNNQPEDLLLCYYANRPVEYGVLIRGDDINKWYGIIIKGKNSQADLEIIEKIISSITYLQDNSYILDYQQLPYYSDPGSNKSVISAEEKAGLLETGQKYFRRFYFNTSDNQKNTAEFLKQKEKYLIFLENSRRFLSQKLKIDFKKYLKIIFIDRSMAPNNSISGYAWNSKLFFPIDRDHSITWVRENLNPIATHEMVHIFQELLNPNYNNIFPRWLTEGMAMTYEKINDQSTFYNEAADNFPDIQMLDNETIDSFNTYFIGNSFCRYLIYERQKEEQFLKVFRESGSREEFYVNFERYFGDTLNNYYQQYRTDGKSKLSIDDN